MTARRCFAGLILWLCCTSPGAAQEVCPTPAEADVVAHLSVVECQWAAYAEAVRQGGQAVRARAQWLSVETDHQLSAIADDDKRAAVSADRDRIRRQSTTRCSWQGIPRKEHAAAAFDHCILNHEAVLWLAVYAVASGSKEFAVLVLEDISQSRGAEELVGSFIVEHMD